MTIIELHGANCVVVHETVEVVREQLKAGGLLALFSGTNGALAPINPAFVLDVRSP